MEFNGYEDKGQMWSLVDVQRLGNRVEIEVRVGQYQLL